MGNKRLINFRLFVFSSLFIIAGIFAVYFLNVDKVAIGVSLLVMSVAVMIALFFLYRKDKVKIVGLIVILIAVITATISTEVAFSSHQNQIKTHSDYVVSGSVVEVVNDGVNKSLIITDVNLDVTQIDGNVVLYLSERFGEIDLTSCRPGDKVVFYGELLFNQLVTDSGVNSYVYKYEIRYSGYANAENLRIARGNPTIIQQLRYGIKSLLIEGLGEKYGNVAYGMLLGDKSSIEYNTRDYFSVSGIGHILSVSGLHVMFLSSMLFWVLRKFRIRRVPGFLVVLTILLFYNVLVGFTVSVVRATIMCVALNIASILGLRNDTFNNLGLAVSLILIASPLSLFDTGFLMSVCAVLGIVLFNKPTQNCLNKVKFLPKFINKAVALSFSAQVGITPILVYYFNTFSVYSVLVNVIMSPILMVAYLLLFVLMIPAIVYRPSSVILIVAKFILKVIDLVAEFVSALPFSEIVVYASGAVLLIYLLYFMISRFFMSRTIKWISSALVFVLICVSMTVSNIPVDKGVNGVYFTADYAQVTSVIRVNERVVVVGDLYRIGNTIDVLEQLRTRNIDAVYLIGVDSDNINGVVSLSRKFDIGAVFIPGGYENEYAKLSRLNVKVEKVCEGQTSRDGLSLVVRDDKIIGYDFSYGQNKILFSSGEVKFNKSMLDFVSDYQIIRALNCNYEHFTQLFINNYGNKYFSGQPVNYVCLENTIKRLNLDTRKIENF